MKLSCFLSTGIIIVAVTPLLMAAMWMDVQPSPKPYQAPVLSPPAGSVPVTGTELVAPDSELRNPVAATGSSLAEGKALYAINCAMCHGESSTKPGPVGTKLKPPPPGLDHALLQKRGDAHIFRAVTFGFGRMPPFKGKLTKQQRWHLVNYLRTRE
ncbi:MAG: menaquinol oxidoreductase [Geobacteraceae bacterium GWC2_53_11]|nr:MAG: menaquinol oxidoreductase [Geobacteraceae bacterium GWC2_53_11]